MGPDRFELVCRQNVGETKGGPGGEAESPVPLIFQIISQEHPALLSFLFDGTPKWEGHQLDLRKNFPEEWGLLVSGRSWGFPSPSALIAKMLQGGGEGIRQMGAPPPPSQCHLLASSQVPHQGPGLPSEIQATANDITPSLGLKPPHVRGPASFSFCYLLTLSRTWATRRTLSHFWKVSVCISAPRHRAERRGCAMFAAGFSREWRPHRGVWKYRAPVSAAGGHEGVCVRGQLGQGKGGP